jgi:hypothetical protein
VEAAVPVPGQETIREEGPRPVDREGMAARAAEGPREPAVRPDTVAALVTEPLEQAERRAAMADHRVAALLAVKGPGEQREMAAGPAAPRVTAERVEAAAPCRTPVDLGKPYISQYMAIHGPARPCIKT